MAPGISLRVAARHLRAKEDAEALNQLADQLVDDFLDLLDPPDEKEVAYAFEAAGVTQEQIGQLSDKAAGFGGSLLRFLMRPFLNLGRLFTSSKFRSQVKGAFRKALSHEVRATRHALNVAGRLSRGDKVSPQERKAAMQQLISILVTVVIAVSAGPGIQGIFSGSIWKAFQAVTVPVQKIVAILLRQPVYDAAKKLLFSV